MTTRVAAVFAEVIAHELHAAAGGLRIAHHGVQPLAIADTALFVSSKEAVELLGGSEVAGLDQLAVAAANDARAFQLRRDDLDLAFGKVGGRDEIGDRNTFLEIRISDRRV